MKQWTILSCFLLGCSSAASYPAKVSLIHSDLQQKPSYIFLADEAFSESQKANLLNGLEEWETETAGAFQFQLSFVPTNQLRKTVKVQNTLFVFAENPGFDNNLGWTYNSPGT